MIAVVSSLNMKKMLKDSVLVRKLAGIETAGSLNLLYTDKTGTITKGKLDVVNFLIGDGTTFTSFDKLPDKIKELTFANCLLNTSAAVAEGKVIGGNMPIVGADGWDSPKLAEIAGEKALNNTFFTNHYSVDDPSEAGKAFVANYTKEFGQKPEALAVLGYDAVYVLVDAIKRANSTDADKIIAALSDTKNFKAVSGITTINASHGYYK